MFGIESLNDEHDCNVVSISSLNIQNFNDDCTSQFLWSEKTFEDVPYRVDRFCKKHNNDRTQSDRLIWYKIMLSFSYYL